MLVAVRLFLALNDSFSKRISTLHIMNLVLLTATSTEDILEIVNVNRSTPHPLPSAQLQGSVLLPVLAAVLGPEIVLT